MDRAALRKSYDDSFSHVTADLLKSAGGPRLGGSALAAHRPRTYKELLELMDVLASDATAFETSQPRVVMGHSQRRGGAPAEGGVAVSRTALDVLAGLDAAELRLSDVESDESL